MLLLYLFKEAILNSGCIFIGFLMQSEHFPFIYCVESLVYHKNYTQWETCFEKLNLKKKLVTDCVLSGRGNEVSSLVWFIANHKIMSFIFLSGFCFFGCLSISWQVGIISELPCCKDVFKFIISHPNVKKKTKKTFFSFVVLYP